MQLKTGVRPTGLRPELLLALIVAAEVWKSLDEELVITSLNDSKHSATSLHYDGRAADLRTNYFTDEEKQHAAAKLRSALGSNPDYDVVVESDHIHLEYQPKRRDA
jgi:hypothetical protein